MNDRNESACSDVTSKYIMPSKMCKGGAMNDPSTNNHSKGKNNPLTNHQNDKR